MPGDNVNIGVATDVGMCRTENQDHFGVFQDAELSIRKGVLLVVADGMGGHSGGVVASHTAVDAFLADFQQSTSEGMDDLLDSAINAANMAVRTKASGDSAIEDMGTTCVGLILRGANVLVGHLGDSRGYHIRDGMIIAITKDHTLINELIDAGVMTAEQGEGHPDKNIITRCVGMSDDIEIEYDRWRLENGDRLLLCSDGLSNFVKDEEMAEYVMKYETQESCEKLIDLANDRGGEDNITVAVVHLVSPTEVDEELAKLDEEMMAAEHQLGPTVQITEESPSAEADDIDRGGLAAASTPVSPPQAALAVAETPITATPVAPRGGGSGRAGDTSTVMVAPAGIKQGVLSGMGFYYLLIAAEALIIIMLAIAIKRY